MNFKRYRGAALISALLITAIATLLSIAIVVSLQLLISETALAIHQDQMQLDLQGVNEWAQSVVIKNEDIAKIKSLQLKLNGIEITGKIEAGQALFNINSLVDTENEDKLVHLMQVALPTVSSQQAQKIASNINAWLLPDSNDDVYLHAKPPYRAAHHPFISLTTLRAVDGVTASIYNALTPYLSALPIDLYQVDINEAPIPVLATIGDNITLAEASALHACRLAHGYFDTTASFMQVCGKLASVNAEWITTRDNYFLVEGHAAQDQQSLQLTSLLQRYHDQHGKILVRTIWQQFNAS